MHLGLINFSFRTSLFIAGSSTYAQLVIVVCIVSVMTQVVKSKSNAFYSEVTSSFSNGTCLTDV